MNKKRLIGYLFVTMSVGCIQAQEQKSSVPEYKLWYDCPAQVWTEALPLGNGRLGAMVYGTPGTEQIQLNEESIWAGRPNNNANPDALEYIPKVRELVFAGKYLEAQTLATEKVMAKTNSSYTSLLGILTPIIVNFSGSRSSGAIVLSFLYFSSIGFIS